RIIRLSTDKEYAEFEAAANYEKLANASSVLGSYEDALNAEEQAMEIYRGLVDAGFAKAPAALVSALNNKATIYHASGNYDSAAIAYTEALDAMHNTDVDPVILARTWGNAGANAVSTGDTAYAAECFEKSLGVLEGTEKTADAIAAAAETNYNYGVLLYRSGQYDRAEERLNTAAEECRLLPTTLLNRRSLVQTLSVLAACCMDQGRFAEADERYLQAESAAEIFALDTENLNNQLMVGNLYNNHGLCRNIQGDYAEADKYYALAAEHYRHLSGSPSGTAVYAVSLLNRGENAFKAGTLESSRAFFEEGLHLYEAIYAELGNYHSAQYHAWRSYYELIHLRDYSAALRDARTAVQIQPDQVLANLNLAYALLYSGQYEECDRLFGILAALGEGQAETIRVDLEAQQNAGMESEHIPAVLEIVGNP
ncbi:MAG: tetratricopeptide repeat protein, partial [Solobacterium sp.]|nr:tetratricopeptide repeat protein [Solobacterium sp.]